MASGCEEKIYAHKTQVLILQMYQGSELGSLRYDSGMVRVCYYLPQIDPKPILSQPKTDRRQTPNQP